MSSEIIRVVRLLEYTGPRDKVEKQLGRSIGDGLKIWGTGDVQIRAATLPADLLRTRPENADYWQSEEYIRHQREIDRLTAAGVHVIAENAQLRELLEQKGANAR